MATGGLAANGSTIGKVTGVLAPSNSYGIGTSAQNLAQAPKPIQTVQHSTPSTPVKSIVTPDGTTTTYHAPTQGTTSEMINSTPAKAPDDPSNKYNTATGQLNSNYRDPNVPILSQQQQNSQVNSQTGVNANGSTTTSNYTPPDQGTNGISQGGLIGNAVGQSQTPNPIAQNAGQNLNNIGSTTSPAIEQANQELENLKNEYMQKGLNIQGTAGFLTQANGEQGLLAQQYNNALAAAQGKLQNALSAQGQQISASSAAGGIGNSIQGLQQGALGTAIGANAPQFGVGYGTQVGNPSAPNGGINTSLNGVTIPANIQTIQSNTQKINDINSQSTAVDNNFSRAVDYATNAGLNDNSPIITGIQSKYQGNVQGSTAIAAFNQVVQQLNQQASALGFAPVDANNVTPSQLKQLQIAVKQKLANDVSNYQSENNNLLNNGSSNTSSNSSGGATGANPWH